MNIMVVWLILFQIWVDNFLKMVAMRYRVSPTDSANLPAQCGCNIITVERSHMCVISSSGDPVAKICVWYCAVGQNCPLENGPQFFWHFLSAKVCWKYPQNLWLFLKCLGLEVFLLSILVFWCVHRIYRLQSRPWLGWLMQAPVPMDTAKWRT